MKRIVIFLALVIFVFFVGLLAFVLRKDEPSPIQNITIDIANFDLENRAQLYIGDELLVGQNIKELENGYYDFKLANREDIVTITLNKLWYKEYGVDYIQDEYLAKICREIVNCINMTFENEELEYQLYKYIKDNYVKAKEGKDIEKIELDKISIWAKSIENECVVYLKVK